MLAVIGGSGLYDLEGLETIREHDAQTPFGMASAPVRHGRLGGREILFLPRHGDGHQLLPSEINYRANIYALKRAGARQLLAVSAVGSLREEIMPGHFAAPSHYFDMTRGHRKNTFFGNGMVAHISTATVTCPDMLDAVCRSTGACGHSIHRDVTYACVEGPRLGTRAESLFLRDATKSDVVGMTNIPELFLAREAQLCSATLAVCTDYDCWKDDPEEHVTVEQVIARFRSSIGKAKEIILDLVGNSLPDVNDTHRKTLRSSLLTPVEALSAEQKALLDILLA